MYRRLIIVSAIIFTALGAFAVLGFHSISLHADGLEGKRLVAFSEVAEQIRIDVKQKLDDFIQTEQKRKYTDYQYFYAPEVVNNGYNNEGNVVLRSPLAKSMSHGMAYGHFQIEPNGKIISPFYTEGVNEKLDSEKQIYLSTLNDNIANSLKNNSNVTAYLEINKRVIATKTPQKSLQSKIKSKDDYIRNSAKKASKGKSRGKGKGAAFPDAVNWDNRANYNVDFVQEGRNQKLQIIKQSRSIVQANIVSNTVSDVQFQTEQQVQVLDSAVFEDQNRAALPVRQSRSPAKPRPRVARQAARPQGGYKPNRKRDTLKCSVRTVTPTERAVVIDDASAPAVQTIGPPDSEPKVCEKEESERKEGRGGRLQVKRRSDVKLAERENPDLDKMIQGVTKKLEQDNSYEYNQSDTPVGQAEYYRTGSSPTAKQYFGQSGSVLRYQEQLQQALADTLAPVDLQQGRQGAQQQTDDMVQIRIEPFVPITVKADTDNNSFFGNHVFLLRHVQIEDDHLLQGFKLNEKELIKEVKESAKRLARKGMGFELSNIESSDAAHAAILDFGFGQVVLNLFEMRPEWIARQVSQLKTWYFAIVTIVLVATLIALSSLWRNLKAQTKLARKKDDFISAVSHELRTPLTTIRMYTEMLEKNWVKTEDKKTEYYGTMRQESERLSRLIENVLDFSRIQRGKKRYNFAIGDINTSVNEVVEMMRPCATKQNFKIVAELSDDIQSTSFDSDAVMQIVINLVDNALKYASNAEDKTITVRTKTEGKYVLIEVGDRGPGIPNTQRKKIFDEFYRIAEESKRETTGTGLGLALVKRFATAHNGFVEALSAKPNGALLRVGLAVSS